MCIRDRPPQQSDSDDGIQVVCPSSTAPGPSQSPADDRVGAQPEPAPSLSEVDDLCSEIGRLVADYIHQHLASTFCAISVR